MPIAHPRRFTSEYGLREMQLVYTSCYKRLPSGGNICAQANFLKQYSYRKQPVSQPIVNGWRQPTPWAMTAHNCRYFPHDYENTYSGSRYRVSGEGPRIQGMPAPARPYDVASGYPTLAAGLSEQTRREALNNIKNQKIDLGVAFGEANETLRLLAQSITRLTGAYRAAKKGNWSLAGNRLGIKGWKSTPNAWLEYQYGWKPLLNDIYGLQEQLKEPIRKDGFLFSSTGERTVEMSPRDAVVNPRASTKVTGFFTHFCRARYFLRVTDSRLYALSQLGLVNPALIAWELTSLSFVIDWFIPIGGFLESLTAHFGTAFIGGFEDRIVSYNIDVEGNWGTFIRGTKERYQSELLAFQRLPLTNALPPGLLSLGSGLSNLPRALSAAALLVTAR